jgi:hypothetical protein
MEVKVNGQSFPDRKTTMTPAGRSGEQFRMVGLWLRNLIRDLPRRSGRLVGAWTSLPVIGERGRHGAWLNRLTSYSFDLIGGPEIAQFFMHLVSVTRPLNDEELRAAAAVLGKRAIRYHDIRVAHGGVVDLVFRLNKNRAFVTWHTINVPIDTQENLPVMVHELTHVYQFERVGSIYIGQGLWVQRKMGRDAYHYGGADGLKSGLATGKRYCHYNREQQGQIAQDFCALMHSGRDTTAYEPFIQELRAGLL